MSRAIQMVGLRFGMLVVESLYDIKNGELRYLCRCECGGISIVLGSNLRRGNTRSCGCLKRIAQQRNKFRPRHGLADTRVHRSWMSMLDRCERETSSAYRNYGGRGIKVCERWSVFENFLADMGPMPDGATLDRINVNGNYEPSNCRWATRTQQGRNQRDNRIIEARGERRCLAEWSEVSGIGRSTIAYRLKAGWSPERAVSQSVRRLA